MTDQKLNVGDLIVHNGYLGMNYNLNKKIDICFLGLFLGNNKIYWINNINWPCGTEHYRSAKHILRLFKSYKNFRIIKKYV